MSWVFRLFLSFYDFTEVWGKCCSGIWDPFLKGTFDFNAPEFDNTLSPHTFLSLYLKKFTFLLSLERI